MSKPLPSTYADFQENREFPREIEPPADTTPEEFQQVGRLLLEHPSLEQADLLIVVGSQNRDFDALAEIWHASRVKRILCTGKPGRIWYESGQTVTVAREAAMELETRGVPASQILVEHESHATHEEASNAHALLKQRGIQVGSILMASHLSHATRCRLSFRHYFPDVTLGSFTYARSSVLDLIRAEAENEEAYRALLTPEGWHQHSTWRNRLWAEYTRIRIYAARGGIASP